MKLEKLAYRIATVVFLAAFFYLYTKGMFLRDQSFGLGMSYALPAVVFLGLAIVTGVMSMLVPRGSDEPS